MPKVPTREFINPAGMPSYNPELSQPGTPEAFVDPSVAEKTRNAQDLAYLGQSMQQTGSYLGDLSKSIRNAEEEHEAVKEYSRLNDELAKISTRELSTELDTAKDAAIRYQKDADAIWIEYSEQIKNPRVAAMVDRLRMRTDESNRERLISHEAIQKTKALKLSNEAVLSTFANNAVAYKDDIELMNILGDAASVNDQYLKHLGTPPEAILHANRELVGQIAKDAIVSKMEVDPDAAMRTFSSLQNQISPKDAAEITKLIDGKRVELTQRAAWDAMSPALQLPDGAYNLAAAREQIDNLPNLTDPQKDKVYDYFQTRAAESTQAYKVNEATRDNEFLNQIAKGKKDGVPADSLLGLAVQYSKPGDYAEIAKKEELIRKMYKVEDNEEDHELYTDLYWGLKDGSKSLNDVRAAASKLTFAHYDSLTKEYVGNVTNFKSGFPAAKGEIDQITFKACGANAKRRKLFEAAILDKAAGRPDITADQLVKIAQEEAKGVVINKWLAQSTMGALGTRKRYEFDQPIPGSPDFKASQRLRDTGRPDTPENRAKVKARHPEWK